MSDSLWPYGLGPARLLCPWDSPGTNTGVGCHFLLQGIFPTQGSNLGLCTSRRILYHWATREAQCCSYIGRNNSCNREMQRSIGALSYTTSSPDGPETSGRASSESTNGHKEPRISGSSLFHSLILQQIPKNLHAWQNLDLGKRIPGRGEREEESDSGVYLLPFNCPHPPPSPDRPTCPHA